MRYNYRILRLAMQSLPEARLLRMRGRLARYSANSPERRTVVVMWIYYTGPFSEAQVLYRECRAFLDQLDRRYNW